MYSRMKADLKEALQEMNKQGLYKDERILAGPQSGAISLHNGDKVLNFCSNNYLGLANHPRLLEAAQKSMAEYGYGLSSVRFICGTQEIHKQLERKIAHFLGTDDTVLYAACFDANGGVFEPLLGEEDVIISDQLNHASIIDGVRLCKSKRAVYRHSDMNDLEQKLKNHAGARYRVIATDGVFSMDGDIARLIDITDLAEQYDALVMVDDSHATGYIGESGRGTVQLHDVWGKIDIITTTFGKALGGANGGCTAGRSEIIEMLRQKSRPYLFSNSLSPALAGATIQAINLVDEEHWRVTKVKENALYFRNEIRNLGYDVLPGDTAIVPIMLYSEAKAVQLSAELLKRGIYVIGFSYPVVPLGKARIRVQLSAAHTQEDLDRALQAFADAGKDLGILY